jgi:L-ascorbate 6-phosphate lactonase
MSARFVAQWPASFLRDLEASSVQAEIELWWLGAASFAFKTSTTLIWIDPYFGPSPNERAVRMIASPLDPRDIRRADAVLASHDHADHCEPETLRAITENTAARLLGSGSAVHRMRAAGLQPQRCEVVVPGDVHTVGDVTLTTLACLDPKEPGSVAFILEANGCCVFFGADGVYTPDFERVGAHWKIDVALLNYGREIYMSADEVVRCACALRTRVVVPFHWDVWKAFRADPQEVVRAAANALPGLEVRVLSLGDCLPVSSLHTATP